MSRHRKLDEPPPLKLRRHHRLLSGLGLRSRRARRRDRAVKEPVVMMPLPPPMTQPEVVPRVTPAPDVPAGDATEDAAAIALPRDLLATARTAEMQPVTVAEVVPRAPDVAASPSRPRKAPLYWRMLRLRHIHPNGWQRALLAEGVLGAAVLLVMADKASIWTLLVLPVVVAALVKVHDLLAGRLRGAARGDGELSRGAGR
jgi:hypothetical protein